MSNNINIQVYSSCNCNCAFCNFKDKCYNQIDPLFVLDYLNKHPEKTYIVLTGGEPTFAIEAYTQIMQGIDKSNKTIVLQTNGWWGNNENIKSQIAANPPTKVHLSADVEKQKYVSIETVVKALEFLNEKEIPVIFINHTNDENEYITYKERFPQIHRGIICEDDGKLYDCGDALLATNVISTLNIKGWGGQTNE